MCVCSWWFVVVVVVVVCAAAGALEIATVAAVKLPYVETVSVVLGAGKLGTSAEEESRLSQRASTEPKRS